MTKEQIKELVRIAYPGTPWKGGMKIELLKMKGMEGSIRQIVSDDRKVAYGLIGSIEDFLRRGYIIQHSTPPVLPKQWAFISYDGSFVLFDEKNKIAPSGGNPVGQKLNDKEGGESMYIVQWCDHEGNLHERRFNRLEDAQAEEAKLLETYDGVAVFSEKGSRICPEK